MSVDRSYLDRIAALRFDGVAWTREKILEVRDFLAPWDHNIALPHGIYTAACDAYYPAHQEIMRVVHDRLGGEFAAAAFSTWAVSRATSRSSAPCKGAQVLGIDGKLLNVRKCEFVRSALDVRPAMFKGDAMEVTPEAVGRFERSRPRPSLPSGGPLHVPAEHDRAVRRLRR